MKTPHCAAQVSDSNGSGEAVGKFDLIELLLNGLPERKIVDVAPYEETQAQNHYGCLPVQVREDVFRLSTEEDRLYLT